MANIVVYNPSDPDVPNRVTKYHKSANTPDYNGEPNKLVNPDLAGVSGVNQLYWKYDGVSAIVEMSQGEKDTLDAALGLSESVIMVDGSFGDSDGNPLKSKTTIYKRIRSFVFSGTDFWGKTPNKVLVNAYITNNAYDGFVRLYDKTEDVALGEATITNTEESLIEITCSNWSATAATIELQGKSENSDNFVCVTGLQILG